jgi:hypothetical protein
MDATTEGSATAPPQEKEDLPDAAEKGKKKGKKSKG